MIDFMIEIHKMPGKGDKGQLNSIYRNHERLPELVRTKCGQQSTFHVHKINMFCVTSETIFK